MSLYLRNILGESVYRGLKSIKIKYFPSKRNRESILLENEAFIRRQKLFSSFINPGDLCFDVGANIGNRIGPLLEIGGKVLAVEPQKSCYTFLRRKYGSKIIIVTKGLSEKEEVKKFYISNDSVFSSFSEEWIDTNKKKRFKGYSWNKEVMTEMTTLDKLIEQYGLPVFIKIDVEGFELEVLRGLSKPIRVISFEYAVPEHAKNAIDCISRIQQISSNCECNYAVGESMELVLKDWITPEQMTAFIHTNEFTNSFFGDIYVRIKSS